VTWPGWNISSEPAIGSRVVVTAIARSLAEDGLPGFGPMPDDAPGTVVSAYAGVTMVSMEPVVKRVCVRWDDPGDTTAEQSWRPGDLEPAT
jgi:hypothetical protein